MENKELSKLAKEIILKGAKQKNIELPEFEIDLFECDVLTESVQAKNPKDCLMWGVCWSEQSVQSEIITWEGIYDKLPSTLNT